MLIGNLVQQFRQTEEIILGKTNVFQLLILNEANNLAYNCTNTFWNLDHNSGGSSCGKAVIIVLGSSALGLGSDIGCSIRMPAYALLNVERLKPISGLLFFTHHRHYQF
ncbi:amidase family protein [Nostoc sp. WHI]|uniref:amidase family protein n=1 Tax=Nostoc sp. WHI TaxID=2650611 RepID=UPI0018C55FF5|nr:hypothetical protein [Nostoc sp. WHI]